LREDSGDDSFQFVVLSSESTNVGNSVLQCSKIDIDTKGQFGLVPLDRRFTEGFSEVFKLIFPRLKDFLAVNRDLGRKGKKKTKTGTE
jgi:hypothetical protein